MNNPRLNVSDDVLDEVLRCLSQGRKLEAVKILRNSAGISLLEAKQLADQLEAEQRSQTLLAHDVSGGEWQIAAQQLLRSGKKLEAIKLCMQQTGSSLQLAKEKVEELAAREGIPDPSIGCLPIVAIALALATAIVVGIVWAMR